MKKKKLDLNKSTIVNLDQSNLAEIQGGRTIVTRGCSVIICETAPCTAVVLTCGTSIPHQC